MYKGRWFVRESIYICGDYMDADVYPVFQPAGKRRKKCKPTSEIQAKLNQRNAEKKITRLVHANFNEEDIALHLTYREEDRPADHAAAQRDLYNFLRRCRRKYKKLDIELKYISCTEEGSLNGRIHHHLFLSGGLDRDALEKLWGKGYANSKRLQFEEDGVAGLAHYTVKNRNSYRRWNQSKNLVQPVPIVHDAVITQSELSEMAEEIEKKNAWQYFEAIYPDFLLVCAAAIQNAVNRGIYVHFDMRRKKKGRRE